MATTTTNLGLTKPAYTDAADIAVINDNMDTLDLWAGQKNDAIANLQSGLAYIVGNTNATGVSLAVGQYVYVKGHSTIPEGLRKVKGSSAIGNGGSITTNNTEACSEGGLNSLFSKFGNVILRQISMACTIPTNGEVDLDISSYTPSGYKLFSLSQIYLGTYMLPYYYTGTLTTRAEVQGTNVRIVNGNTNWGSNYRLNCLAIYIPN